MYDTLKHLLKAYHEMGFFAQILTGAFFLYATYVVAEYIFGTLGMFMKMLALLVAPVILGALGLFPFLSRFERLHQSLLGGLNWLVMSIPAAMEWVREIAAEANAEAKEEAKAESKTEPKAKPA